MGLLPPATYLGQLQCRAQLAPCTGQRRYKSLQSIFLLLSDREETGGQLPARRKALSRSLRRWPRLAQPPNGTVSPRGCQGPWQLASGPRGSPRAALQPQSPAHGLFRSGLAFGLPAPDTTCGSKGLPLCPCSVSRGPGGSPAGGGRGAMPHTGSPPHVDFLLLL